MGQLPYFFLCFGTPDNTFEYQTVDGIINILFCFDGGEKRMQQAPPVDETLAGLGFVHSGNEVGGTVGLAEFNVVSHALHVYRKFHRFLCELIHDFAFRISCRVRRLFLRRACRSAFIDLLIFVPTAFSRLGNSRQGSGKKFCHCAFLVLLAP